MGWDEIRVARRRLFARPALSALSIAILSLGLAATLFLFGALNGLVLQPLPYPDAERLTVIGWQESGAGGNVNNLSASDWARLRDELSGFEALAIDGGPATVNLGHGERVRRYNGALIDHAVLPTLGVAPILGRGFAEHDDAPGAEMTVLLSERVWRNEFHADPAIVGARIRANGEPATVIGVLPDSFGYPQGQEVWIPRRFQVDDDRAVNVLARLAPGIGLDVARQSTAALAERLGTALSGAQHGYSLGVEPLANRYVNEVTRRMAWMMFASGLLVLLLACANVANLQLARVLDRRRELAVCSALGASRKRLLRELFAESLLMAVPATALAVLLTHVGNQWVLSLMTANEFMVAHRIDFDYDARDLVFLIGAALASCLLIGLVPALRAAGTQVQDALRDGSKGSQGGVFARITRGLVVAEIALTVVLLVGAMMFVRGIQGMVDFDYGADADPSQVLTARIGLFPQQYPDAGARLRFYEQAVARLREDPQVVAASFATGIPGAAGQGGDAVIAEGEARPSGGYWRTDHAWVDAGFAQTYGLRLLEGRFIDERDRADTAPVAVIDRRLAQRLFPDRPALGQRLVMDPEAEQPQAATVVGVIDDLHLRELDSGRRSALLRPLAQAPPAFATVAVRVRGDGDAYSPRLIETLRELEPDSPLYWLRSQARAVHMGWVGPRLLTQIFGGVGVLALILAAAGLYGVLAYSVAQRTREIGIRRAIGAGASGVVALVGRRIGWQVLLGLGIGLALALPWSKVLENPVLTAGGSGPLLFVLVAGLVLLVAVVASLAPLRRALRVDPVVALRQD